MAGLAGNFQSVESRTSYVEDVHFRVFCVFRCYYNSLKKFHLSGSEVKGHFVVHRI